MSFSLVNPQRKDSSFLSFVSANTVLLGASQTSRDPSHKLRPQARVCPTALPIHSHPSGAESKGVSPKNLGF